MKEPCMTGHQNLLTEVGLGGGRVSGMGEVGRTLQALKAFGAWGIDIYVRIYIMGSIRGSYGPLKEDYHLKKLLCKLCHIGRM